MTINSETRVAGPFDGNDSTVSFPFTFKVFDSDEVRVVAETGAVETDLELGTDYTVILNADQNAAPGGSVVLAAPLATGTRLTLTSALEILQPVDLTNQGGFYPRVINSALDRLTILLQQLASVVSRTLKFPLSDGPVGDLPGRSVRAGTVLAFDEATGEPVAGPDISSVNGVAGALVAVNTVANNITDVNTVAANIADVNAVGQSITDVNTIVDNMADVNTVAQNIGDVNTVADNIADVANFAGVYYGPSASDPTTRRDGSPLQVGDLYFNSSAGVLLSYDGGEWRYAVGGAITVQNLSGNGSTTAFVLDYAPASENVTNVYIGGAYQQKNTYSLAGDVLTFSAAPPAGTDNIEVVVTPLVPSDDQLRADLAAAGGVDLVADAVDERILSGLAVAGGAAIVGRAAQVVDSIAELRLLDKTAVSQHAFVTGYYAQGDGGGGAYHLDTTDSTSEDDGGSIIVANDGGRWRLSDLTRISVRQFGAKGDGVTDDTASIQAALTAVDTLAPNRGGIVHFPPGVYLVSGTLRAKPNTHLAGAGHRIGCVLLRYADYGNTVECGDDTTGAQGFKVTDLEFFHGGIFNGTEGTLPNRVTQGSHLHIRGGNMVFVERCHFYRMRYNIRFLGGAWVHLKDNLFYGVFNEQDPAQQEGFASVTAEQDPIHGHAVEWYVTGNNFAGSKKPLVGYQIVAADRTYTTTEADAFTYVMAAAVAFEIHALESAVIANNYFGGASRYAIGFVGYMRPGIGPFNPFNIRITGNMFDPSLIAQVGFVSTIEGCYAMNVVISANTFIGDRNGRHAILAIVNPNGGGASVRGLTVSGNAFSGHFGTPVLLDGAVGFNVSANTINDYNKLNVSETDMAFVAAVSVRGVSSKGLIASNTIGGGFVFSGTHYCKQGIYVEWDVTETVQSGNMRVGTDNWTAQTYPA